ncbi:MAG: hypothetical protein QOF26_2476 [Baekduia sp.]|jgi:hypothetical protein|nr:hypothetical protein [Baekduia sp.]
MARLDHLTRRRALTLGGASLAGLVLPRSAAGAASAHAALYHRSGTLPVGAIQSIIGAEGSVSAGVLDITIDRKDVGPVKGPMGVTFPPSFEVNGDLTFQPLGTDLAFFNGDLALKAAELNPVIDAIHKNGLTFQAMHQHYFDLDPMVWFIHFRGVGKPRTLAHAVRGVLAATSTPLPQKPPAKPTTPLDHGKLAKTLHGSSEIGDDGVVTISVSRSDRIIIDNVQVSPEANISTNIEFLPLDAKGTKAAAAPDFSMTASEVEPVVRRMRAAGFEIGCLYNQETDEHPQLYFAHMLAVGDPQSLAVTIRKGLDLTNAD